MFSWLKVESFILFFCEIHKAVYGFLLFVSEVSSISSNRGFKCPILDDKNFMKWTPGEVGKEKMDSGLFSTIKPITS